MPSNRDYKAPGVFAEDASTTIPTVPITGASYRDPDSDQNIGNGWPFGQLVNSARFNQIMYKLTRLIKGVDEQGILSWSSATDYGVDAVVIGSDGQEYVSTQASGPSGAGAQDPVSAPAYWRTKAATQTETNTGVGDRFFVTPRKLRFGFAISIGQNGYIKFPSWMGGLIVQWGFLATPSLDTVVTASFPIAFPNACLSAQATGRNTDATGPSTKDPTMQISTFTATSISIRVNATASGMTAPPGAYWIAIGH